MASSDQHAPRMSPSSASIEPLQSPLPAHAHAPPSPSHQHQSPSFESPLCSSCGDAVSSTVQCVTTGFLCDQPHYLESLRKSESYLCCTPNSYDEHPCCWDQSQKLVFASTAPSARKVREGSHSLELPTLGYRSPPLARSNSLRGLKNGMPPSPTAQNANTGNGQDTGIEALEDTSITPIYCFCIQHLDCAAERNGVPPCYCCTAIIAPAICSFPLRACFHLLCCVPECLVYCHHSVKARTQFKDLYGIQESGCSSCLALSCFSLADQQMAKERSLRPAPIAQTMKMPPKESAPSPSPSTNSLTVPSETKPLPLESSDNAQR